MPSLTLRLISHNAEAEKHPIDVRGLVSSFGDNVIHDGLDLKVERGEVLGVVGGSGTGKSVLLNTIIGLKTPDGGQVRLFGGDMRVASRRRWSSVERRWGVLFQQGALFSNLTVRENVAAPLHEHTRLPRREIDEMDVQTVPEGAAGTVEETTLFGQPKVVCFDVPTVWGPKRACVHVRRGDVELAG